MRFLCHTLTWDWCREHAVPLLNDEEGASGAPRLADDPRALRRARHVHAAAGKRAEAETLARAAVDALGVWDQCLLWTTDWDVWPNEEDWPRYYAWRGAHGERRSVGEAPGHVFAHGEEPALAWLLAYVIECGWDASVVRVLGGAPTGIRLHASHDEWLAFASAHPIKFAAPAG
jgi:hypothetical protein